MSIWIIAGVVSLVALVVCFVGGDFEVAVGQVSGAFFVAAWVTFWEKLR